MFYLIGGAAAFACLGVGAYLLALTYEQISDTRYLNSYGRQ